MKAEISIDTSRGGGKDYGWLSVLNVNDCCKMGRLVPRFCDVKRCESILRLIHIS